MNSQALIDSDLCEDVVITKTIFSPKESFPIRWIIKHSLRFQFLIA